MILTHLRKFSVIASFALLMIGESACGTASQSAQGSQAAQAAISPLSDQPTPSSGSTFARTDGAAAPAGSFGGLGILLTPQSTEQVAVHMNCANGTIATDLTAVADGSSFQVEGTWTTLAGPITPAGRPTLSAHYTGQLSGHHLHLTVLIDQTDGTTAAESYDAYAGQAAVYNQACPI